MTAFLPLLVSIVILTTATRSETGGNCTTSSAGSPKTDGNAKSPCCTSDNLEGDIHARFERSPSSSGVAEVASGKGISFPNVKPSQRSKGKESLSDMGLLSRGKGMEVRNEGKSRGGHQEEQERGHLEEVLEESGDGTSNGGGVIWKAPSREGIKPSANTVDSATESDQQSSDSSKKRGLQEMGEDGKGNNHFLSGDWSKPKSAQGARNRANSSRTRRDLKTLKRMLDDTGVVSADSEELPEGEEPQEMNEEEPEMDDDNFEVPHTGDSLSGDATRRQDFSKRPKYYPDWGPKRTWRINMMRVWGKRYLAGYDKKHALWNN